MATYVDKFNQLLTEVSAIGGNDLNGNALIIDADGDTYLQASSDDITVLTAGGIPFAYFDAPGHQFKIEWTDPGATEGPEIQIGRYSPTPAANDAAGVLRFMANDASGNAQTYVKFRSIIDDPTYGSEDGSLEFTVARGGALVEAFRPRAFARP